MQTSHGEALQVDEVETWDVTGQGLEGWGETVKRAEEVSNRLPFFWWWW